MFTLVYRSKAKKSFDLESISKMLNNAQKFNRRNNITGCLLYHCGNFVQLIEGEKMKVKSLYRKIYEDNRHYDVHLMSMENSPFRMFTNWSMVFENLGGDIVRNGAAKRQLFDEIYHSSNAICHPGATKLALWIAVNKTLQLETNVTDVNRT